MTDDLIRYPVSLEYGASDDGHARRAADTPCWLCQDLKGLAIHQHWTAQRGKPLWTAHKPASRSHPVRDCPECEAERLRAELAEERAAWDGATKARNRLDCEVARLARELEAERAAFKRMCQQVGIIEGHLDLMRQMRDSEKARADGLVAERDRYDRENDSLTERIEQLTAERDTQRQRAEQAEAAIARVRAEHAAIHADADEFERTHNPQCECEIAPASRVAADRMLAALDASTAPESLCPRCEGSRVEPGTEAEGDWDPAAMRHHPYTGDPCTACNGTGKATGWLDRLAAGSLAAARDKFGPGFAPERPKGDDQRPWAPHRFVQSRRVCRTVCICGKGPNHETHEPISESPQEDRA